MHKSEKSSHSIYLHMYSHRSNKRGSRLAQIPFSFIDLLQNSPVLVDFIIDFKPFAPSLPPPRLLTYNFFVFNFKQYVLTNSKAFSTSPGLLNLLAIISSNSGNLVVANKTGAVARPSFKSAAAGLPNCSELASKSKRSSTN